MYTRPIWHKKLLVKVKILVFQRFWNFAKCCNFLNGWDQHKQRLKRRFIQKCLIHLVLDLIHWPQKLFTNSKMAGLYAAWTLSSQKDTKSCQSDLNAKEYRYYLDSMRSHCRVAKCQGYDGYIRVKSRLKILIHVKDLTFCNSESLPPRKRYNRLVAKENQLWIGLVHFDPFSKDLAV